MAPAVNVDILDEAEAGIEVARLAGLARFVLAELRVHPAAEMCMRLVNKPTIAVLNEKWMGHEGPTDVLSFPLDELTPGNEDEESDEGYLGDIALCVEVAAQQAPANGNSTLEEVELLTVHGILHLLGYDHAEPEEHREMFGLQDRLLEQWRRRSHEGDS